MVRSLGADAILGVSFQTKYVEAICCRKRIVEMDNGDIVPIVRRAALPLSTKPILEPPKIPRRGESALKAVRCAKTIRIPALSEANVKVT